MLAEAVQAFRADFQEATRQAARLEAEVAAFFGRAGAGGTAGGAGFGDGAALAEIGRLASRGLSLGPANCCCCCICLLKQPAGDGEAAASSSLTNRTSLRLHLAA